jgi:hypothetical protein
VDPRYSTINTPEIPPDVEARYKEIQEELQRLSIAPEATAGESRAARYARRQRIKALRTEFDSMARTPLARRQRTGYTVLAMVGVALLLCALSLGGGVLLANQLNRPPDISSTATGFLDKIKQQDYGGAYAYLARGFEPEAFTLQAQTADTQFGSLTNYTKLSQQGGQSGDTTGSASFEVYRSGGTVKKANHYVIVLQFTYASNTWQIFDYGEIFKGPSS